MADTLIVIERKEWRALRDLFSPNDPSTFTGHCCVDNFIRWTDQQPDLPNLTFYSLNGDWSDGTFVVIYHDVVYMYTLAATNERLRKLLQLLDFSKGMKIYSIQSKIHPTIRDVVQSKGSEIKYDVKTLMHHLPAKDALQFDVTPPADLTLKPIAQSDVHIAYEVWSHRDGNSPQFLQQLAQYNPSFGAYDNEGRMIAWIFRLHAGQLGALQVDKEFYGRGLGMLLAKALSRKIAESGQDIGACIFNTNTHSLSIFEKLGFSVVDDIHWMEILPIE